MRGRAVVPAKPFLRLLEVAADDVLELLEVHLGVRIEGVDVVHAYEPRRHVVLVIASALVLFNDVRLRLIIVAEELAIEIGIAVADRLVGEETQRLMHSDCVADLFIDIRRDHLRTPVAVVAADEAHHRDVVKETGQHDLLAVAVLYRKCRALQEMVGRGEAILEVVHQRWLFRHRRQPRVRAHVEVLAGVLVLQRRAALHLHPPVGQIAEHRLGDDLVELVHHLFFEMIGTLGERHLAGDLRGIVVEGHEPPHSIAARCRATRIYIEIRLGTAERRSASGQK